MPGNYKSRFKRYKRKLRWKAHKYPAFQKMSDIVQGPWGEERAPHRPQEEAFPEDVNPCPKCGGSGMDQIDPNDFCHHCNGSGVDPDADPNANVRPLR